MLELIREYDDAYGWSGPGLNSCAHWLNWKCGLNLGAAREKVRVATMENEDYLLGIARHGTAAHVERLVRNYKKVKRNEALERDNDRHVLRQLDWFFDDDDSMVIKGRFTPEQGMLIKKVLESIMDEDFLEQKEVLAETFLR